MKRTLAVDAVSLDCGKNTWLNHAFQPWSSNYRGVAGRISLSDFSIPTETPMLFVKLGAYNQKVNPAALLFRAVECNGSMARFFYDNEGDSGTEYSREDLAVQYIDASDPTWIARSVMVPPGYRLVLFSSDVWLGKKQVVYGAYADGEKNSQRVKC